MNRIRILVVLAALLISVVAVNVSFAQGPDGDRGSRREGRGDRMEIILDTVSAATGLEREAIVEMLREDEMTLAEIISANGGDVATVQADLVTQLTENFTGNIEQNVDDILNNPLPQRGEGRGNREGRGFFGDRLDNPLLRQLIEASQIDLEILREGFQADQSLSDLINANGGDVAAVTATAKTAAEERIAENVAEGRMTQAEADQRLANLDELLATAMNSTPTELRQQAVFMRGVNRAVLDAAAEALGVDSRDLRRDLDGQSLNDYLAAQGADVTAISAAAATNAETAIAQAVTDGDLTQEAADILLADLDQAIADALARIPRDGGRRGGR
jgi:hypothetical protein